MLYNRQNMSRNNINGQRSQTRCNQPDIHELLKGEIYKQTSSQDTNFRFGANAPLPIVVADSNQSGQLNQSQQVIQYNQPYNQPVVSPSAKNVGFEDIEIYFDSTQRDASSGFEVGEVKWTIPTFNNGIDIKNCVQLHIPDFYFPKIYPASGKPEYFYFQRVYMEFQGAPSSQAVLGPNNNKYHIEFDVENITSQAVKLIPVKRSFFFQRPIVSISDLQMRFMVPPMGPSSTVWRKIPIPSDTVTINSLLTVGVGYNPIRFEITGLDTTSVLNPIGVLSSPGLAVFISGYTSNDAAINSAVNSADGVYVTNVISATTFEIAGINASTVTAAFTATMFIPKNRFAFPIRFTTIRDQLTNYIGVSHD